MGQFMLCGEEMMVPSEIQTLARRREVTVATSAGVASVAGLSWGRGSPFPA